MVQRRTKPGMRKLKHCRIASLSKSRWCTNAVSFYAAAPLFSHAVLLYVIRKSRERRRESDLALLRRKTIIHGIE